MKKGKDIALITDAGTPGISDPGEDLVRLCYENGVEVTSLPGACACVTAIVHLPDYPPDVSVLRHFFHRIKKKNRKFWKN